MFRLFTAVLMSIFIIQCNSQGEGDKLVGEYVRNGSPVFELTQTKFIWMKGGSKESRMGDWNLNDDGALCVNGVDEFIRRFCEPSQCPEKGQDLCMKYELNENSDELTIYYPDDGGVFEVEIYRKGIK